MTKADTPSPSGAMPTVEEIDKAVSHMRDAGFAAMDHVGLRRDSAFGHDLEVILAAASAIRSRAQGEENGEPLAEGDSPVEPFVNAYEWRGDGGDYIPTTRERVMMADAIHDFIAEHPRAPADGQVDPRSDAQWLSDEVKAEASAGLSSAEQMKRVMAYLKLRDESLGTPDADDEERAESAREILAELNTSPYQCSGLTRAAPAETVTRPSAPHAAAPATATGYSQHVVGVAPADPVEKLVEEARQHVRSDKARTSYDDALITRLADALSSPAPSKVEAEAETYRDMHQIAKELGFPSILEALEDVDTSRARVAELEKAICWVLGYDMGEPQFPGLEVKIAGRVAPYGWRNELRRRARMPLKALNAESTLTKTEAPHG